jgi:hypothetical protein
MNSEIRGCCAGLFRWKNSTKDAEPGCIPELPSHATP